MSLPRETKLPAIPAVPSRAEGLVPVVKAMKEIIEAREGTRGTDLDKAMTLRDAVEIGLVTYNGGDYSSSGPAKTFQPNIPDPEAPDMTVPPTPTGFTGSVGFATVTLQWTDPTTLYGNHSHAEIWRATSNNLALAVMVGTSDGFMYADTPGATGTTYYYWVRFVSTADVAGPYQAGASGGLARTTKQVETADYKDLSIVNAAIQSLSADKITTGYLAAARIEANSLDASKIKANSITASFGGFDTGAIQTLWIGNDQVTVPSGTSIGGLSSFVTVFGSETEVYSHYAPNLTSHGKTIVMCNAVVYINPLYVGGRTVLHARLYRDATVIKDFSAVFVADNVSTAYQTFVATTLNLVHVHDSIAGSPTYTLKMWDANYSGTSGYTMVMHRGITVIQGKR